MVVYVLFEVEDMCKVCKMIETLCCDSCDWRDQKTIVKASLKFHRKNLLFYFIKTEKRHALSWEIEIVWASNYWKSIKMYPIGTCDLRLITTTRKKWTKNERRFGNCWISCWVELRIFFLVFFVTEYWFWGMLFWNFRLASHLFFFLLDSPFNENDLNPFERKSASIFIYSPAYYIYQWIAKALYHC